jgi:sialate O-acetylesterase
MKKKNGIFRPAFVLGLIGVCVSLGMEKENKVMKKENSVLRLASVFGDHAVLQREVAIPVWGAGTPLGQIECRLGAAAAMTVASEDGRFMVRFGPQAAGGPLTLRVTDLASGEEIVRKDIYIGEVWVASGQSNMEMPLSGVGDADPKADLPRVRFYRVPVTAYPAGRREAGGYWEVCTPETAGKFSAVAFYFARARQPEVGVAVGIIQSAMGGTNIEAWMSRAALLEVPEYAAEMAEYDRAGSDPKLFAAYPKNERLFDMDVRVTDLWRRIFPAMPENTGEPNGWAKPEFDDSRWETMALPDNWTMAGYNHAGVFWFRRGVELPASWAGKDLVLGLGAVDKADITYFNGVKIGATGDGVDMAYWNRLRRYEVPGTLVRAGRNVLAVRAASAVSICMDGGLIGPAEAMTVAVKGRPETAISLAGDWRFKMEHNLGTDGAEKMRLMGAGGTQSLHILFDNMIAPLIPYAVRGALWYQGEANAICGAGRYRKLLGGLIRDWPRQWGQREFAFLIVQLPGCQAPRLHSPHSQWALLREAQALAAADTGQPPAVVTIDCGDPVEQHPVKKEPVGRRLALTAAGRYGPAFKSMKREGARLRVEFETYGSPLAVRGTELDGFVIAGGDGVFHPATAEISSPDTVTVFCPEVKEPVTVRYAWSNNPARANLTNRAGWPAGPFRAEAK